MNDQENYSGTCYNSAGTSMIACPQQTYIAPTACGTYLTQASCTTSSSGCSWQNNACMPTSSTSNTCPSGQYWYVPTSGGAGYCTSTTTTTTGTCPSGQYWYTPPSGGAGYCMTSSATTCPSGQYWNGTACVSSSTTTTGTCPSGQSWYTPPGGGAGYCMSLPSTYPTPTTTYPTPTGTYPTPAYMTPAESYPTPATTYPTPTTTYPTPTTTYPTPAYSYPTPTTTYPTPAYMTPPTGMLLCNQSGGSWTGAACNLAENTSNQKAYYSYYQKQSSPLLAQVLRAFADLFR